LYSWFNTTCAFAPRAVAVRLVADVGDVLDLARANQIGDLLGEPRLVHLVGELRDHDVGAVLRAFLHRAGRADLDRATSGLVGVLDALAAHDRRARREVRGLHELHQVRRRGLRVVEVVGDGVDHLAHVVGRDVGGHADRDAGSPVHEQVREARRQHDGLLLVPVEVRHEVDRLAVDLAQELHRHRGEAGLGVPVGGGRVAVHRAEVAVAVDQRRPHHPFLGHADQGVVHGLIAMRVVLLQDLADGRHRLAVRPVRAQARLEHGPQDPALDRLETVADVGQRASDDHRHRVIEVGALDLVLELHGLDPACEQVLRHVGRQVLPGVRRRGSGRTWRSSR
jgi:hypothetical protein